MARTEETAKVSAILHMHKFCIFVLCLTFSEKTVEGQTIGCFVDADWTSRIKQATDFLHSRSEVAGTSSGNDNNDLTEIQNSNANIVLTEIRHPLAITAAVCSNQSMSSPVLLVFMSAELLEVLAAESKILEVPLITALVTDEQDNGVPSTVSNMRPSTFGVLMDLSVHQYRWKSGIYLGDSRQASLVFMKNYNKLRTENKTFSLDMAIYIVSNLSDAVTNLTDGFTLLNSTVLESEDFFWRIVLDMSPRTAEDLVDAMFKNRKLLQRNFHFLLASLDSEGFDFSKFDGSGWKFTAISLLDNDYDATFSLGQQWNQYTGEPLTSEAALTIDSILLGQRTANAYLTWKQRCQQASASCSARNFDVSAVCGASLEQDAMLRMPSSRSEIMHGFTGPISFTEKGQRINVTFRITETRHNGSLREVGTWNDVTGLSMDPKSYVKSIDRSRPLRVVSLVVEPFLFPVSNDCSSLQYSMADENGQCYSGHHVEFLRRLENSTGFTFVLHVNREAHIALADGEWTSVIGEILRGEADLALTDMSVLSSRQAVVDFTDNFMTDGVSILMRKPTRQRQKDPSSRFIGFLQPFTLTTWMCVVGAVLITSLFMYFVGRLTPDEWETVNENEATFITNKFTARETSWSVLSVALSRPYTIKPKSTAVRIAHASWFFWCLVIVASYTANLAAFLTEADIKSIESVADLVKQNETTYGTPKNLFSTTEHYRTSLDPMFHQIWEHINFRNSYAKDVNDGIAKARTEPYAFIVQSTVIEFVTNTAPCDLMQVGPILFYNIYAIAVPKGSPLGPELSLAINELKEQGLMEVMRNKWFGHDKNECGKIQAQGRQRGMSFIELSGVFILLGTGLILALLAAIIELCFLGHKTIAEREKSMIFGEKVATFILQFVAKHVLGTPHDSDNAGTGEKKRSDRELNMCGPHACSECGQTIKKSTKRGNPVQTRGTHANGNVRQGVRSETGGGLGKTVPSQKDVEQGIRDKMRVHETETIPSREEIELEVRNESCGQPSDATSSEGSIKQGLPNEIEGELSEVASLKDDYEQEIRDEEKSQPSETHPEENIKQEMLDEIRGRLSETMPPKEEVKQEVRNRIKGQVREVIPSKEDIKKRIRNEIKDQVSEIIPPKEEVKKAIRNKIKGQVLKILPSKEVVVQGILNTIKGALNNDSESE